jgi:hypothetical protein
MADVEQVRQRHLARRGPPCHVEVQPDGLRLVLSKQCEGLESDIDSLEWLVAIRIQNNEIARSIPPEDDRVQAAPQLNPDRRCRFLLTQALLRTLIAGYLRLRRGGRLPPPHHECRSGVRAAALFSCWTRKEAYVKAIGTGLDRPLDRFRVSLDPRQPPALLRIDDDDPSFWFLHSTSSVRGVLAALACRCAGKILHEWPVQDVSHILLAQ